ncbi:hypothetical protein AB7M56_007337 [Bradyrhizobium elkanii]|nr:hypothetical protein [Bradyrhizobium elkanii]MCS4068169.1 hypothetical protein [Bradyrhizobium elkanii]MCS4083704.1 hypothetical protein [Bradyrhizobium elkanii]MDH6686412.1 hypothetical protein [Bradyrhizobium elkanii]
MIGFAKLLWHPAAGEIAHVELPSTGARIAFLLASFAIVLLFEAAFPLFSYGRSDRLRNIGRNAAITVIFVGVNLLLSPLSPLAAQWTLDAKFGLSWWLGLSPPSQLLLGIIGLDLFAYFAHVSMHKLGWMWRFHRMHHADRFVDSHHGLPRASRRDAVADRLAHRRRGRVRNAGLGAGQLSDVVGAERPVRARQYPPARAARPLAAARLRDAEHAQDASFASSAGDRQQLFEPALDLGPARRHLSSRSALRGAALWPGRL